MTAVPPAGTAPRKGLGSIFSCENPVWNSSLCLTSLCRGAGQGFGVCEDKDGAQSRDVEGRFIREKLVCILWIGNSSPAVLPPLLSKHSDME